MSDDQRPLVGIWCAITVFLSAFLLFQVQPVISKAILPWFGGSPSVWTACLLFFQTLLLLGYVYAHLLVQGVTARWAAVLHLTLLLLAVVLLPITPAESWKPDDAGHPTPRILVLLAAHVGLPYFLLASTAPLIQVFYDHHHGGRRTPYRLYALSNTGSLLALLSYPFLVEPAMTTEAQGLTWSSLFGLFALIGGGLTLLAARRRWFRPREVSDLDPLPDASGRGEDPGTRSSPLRPAVDSGGLDLAAAALSEKIQAPPAPSGDDRVTIWRGMLWILLPALASMLLLAITQHVCQDVAVVPFLWVVPLSIYLLSFIICFDREAWYRRRVFGLLSTLAIVWLAALLLEERTEDFLAFLHLDWSVPDLSDSVVLEASVYFSILFLVCMVCHGELVRLKPPSRWLTSFYLGVAAGGALGGAFVALVCPLVFSSYFETRLGLMAGGVLGVLVLCDDARRTWLANRKRLLILVTLPAAAVLAVVAAGLFRADETKYISVTRSFYGVLKVKEAGEGYPDEHRRCLYHGRILHGVQFLDEGQRRIPTTYYNESSGIGLAILHYPRIGPLKLGAVGLGAGTLAAYGEPGDTIRFYEINPQVLEINRKYFTYLEDSKANVDVVLGDARLSLEREPSQQFDVLAVDAFNGDAIPTHLLTLEAINVYRRHMRPGGIIALHVSNRHLDLVPVVRALADAHSLQVVLIDTDDEGGVADAGSTWMLLTVNQEFLQSELIQESESPLEDSEGPPCLWTDQFSNLLQILK